LHIIIFNNNTAHNNITESLTFRYIKEENTKAPVNPSDVKTNLLSAKLNIRDWKNTNPTIRQAAKPHVDVITKRCALKICFLSITASIRNE
jgi:hypothetical protein